MRTKRALVKLLVGATALGASATGVSVLTAAGASTPSGTVISASSGPYGTMLVVGSGKFAGYTLYLLTSDKPPSYGCTTTPQNLMGHMLACTGPSSDQNAEWPAITTTGSPVAGPGVSQALLGTVDRAGIGEQVTYAGHPLYLFDMGPGQVTGEDWDEPGLPPWHGLWYLVSPSGRPLPGAETLTIATIGRKRVLAAVKSTLLGSVDFPVYAFSADTRYTSSCNGSCAATWPPLLTSGSAGVTAGLSASQVGTIARSDGARQVTYEGHPLYFYSQEALAPNSAGTIAATGSGNNIHLDGGTFDLLSTP